jgi:hypothetical protein
VDCSLKLVQSALQYICFLIARSQCDLLAPYVHNVDAIYSTFLKYFPPTYFAPAFSAHVFSQLQANSANIWMRSHRSHSLFCTSGERVRPQQARVPVIYFFIPNLPCLMNAFSSWGFPKGKLSRNESEMDCAVR